MSSSYVGTAVVRQVGYLGGAVVEPGQHVHWDSTVMGVLPHWLEALRPPVAETAAPVDEPTTKRKNSAALPETPEA